MWRLVDKWARQMNRYQSRFVYSRRQTEIKCTNRRRKLCKEENSISKRQWNNTKHMRYGCHSLCVVTSCHFLVSLSSVRSRAIISSLHLVSDCYDGWSTTTVNGARKCLFPQNFSFPSLFPHFAFRFPSTFDTLPEKMAKKCRNDIMSVWAVNEFLRRNSTHHEWLWRRICNGRFSSSSIDFSFHFVFPAFRALILFHIFPGFFIVLSYPSFI